MDAAYAIIRRWEGEVDVSVFTPRGLRALCQRSRRPTRSRSHRNVAGLYECQLPSIERHARGRSAEAPGNGNGLEILPPAKPQLIPIAFRTDASVDESRSVGK